MSSTEQPSAADGGSECKGLLGPLPDEFWRLINAWTAAHPSPMGRQDIGWALESCVKQYAAHQVAAERERWRALLEARAAGCERAAENTEDSKSDAMARVLMSVRDDGSRA